MPIAASSSPGRLTSASEVSSSSSVDSGVAGRGFPSACAISHTLSFFSLLFVFLSAAASAVSFRFFTAYVCRRLTSLSSGIVGLEGWHLRLTPCKTQSNQSQGAGKGIAQVGNESNRDSPLKGTLAQGAS